MEGTWKRTCREYNSLISLIVRNEYDAEPSIRNWPRVRFTFTSNIDKSLTNRTYKKQTTRIEIELANG